MGGGGKEADLAVAVAFCRKTRVFPETSRIVTSFCVIARTGLHGHLSYEEDRETGNRIGVIALDHPFLMGREGKECGWSGGSG